jgi:hypothetical protein
MNPSGEVEVSKPQAFTPSNGSFHMQDKLPGEMALNYHPQNDFEPNSRDIQRGGLGQNGSMMSQYNPYYQYASHYYDPFIDATGPFTSKFPRAKDYSNAQSITEGFPHLSKVNDADFDIESISEDAHFYILRSSNDDNIHKAIKYQVWTSTPGGNGILRKAWQEFQATGKTPEIYLFFSVVSSNQFLGVAKMTADINDNESFKYWWEPCKWFGTFQISWHFVKDIHYAKFEQIREESFMTSVINLKDGTKISSATGKEMLAVFKSHPAKPSIFDYFDYMDRREDYIRTQRDNSEFEKYFDECCEAYLENPESVFPQRRPYYPRRGGRKPISNGGYGQKRYNNKNNYYPKSYHYKNGDSYNNNSYNSTNNTNTNKDNRSDTPTKNLSLAEQFIIRTEADKLNKSNKKNKKVLKKGQNEKINIDFLEMGKDTRKFKNYQEEGESHNGAE